MTEKVVVFKSMLSEPIAGYIDEKKAVGYKYNKGSSLLKQFDTLVVNENLLEVNLPKELVLLWTKKGRMRQPVLEMEEFQLYVGWQLIWPVLGTRYTFFHLP